MIDESSKSTVRKVGCSEDSDKAVIITATRVEIELVEKIERSLEAINSANCAIETLAVASCSFSIN